MSRAGSMRAYTIHAPPGEPARPERFVFVKDGFSWPALFVPLLWILWHRLWLTLVLFVLAVSAFAWAGRFLNEDAAGLVALLGAILFALEANNIRRLSLARRGWREMGGSFGRNLDEAEMRFFESWNRPGAGRAAAERRDQPAVPPRRLQAGEEPILGLFPEPER